MKHKGIYVKLKCTINVGKVCFKTNELPVLQTKACMFKNFCEAKDLITMLHSCAV